MNQTQVVVLSTEELIDAVANPQIAHISIAAELAGLPTLQLSRGQTLIGTSAQAALRFAPGQHGLRLCADNHVEGPHVVTDPDHRAIYNDSGVEQLGRLVLRKLRVTGVVQLLARDRVRGGHVEVHDIDIEAADARAYDERPKGYGVEVIQGAFTLWNRQADPAVTITADLSGLSAGREGAPVRGSGIFVGGAGDTGGQLIARRVETGAVYSDGGIAHGTPDRITGGVFIVSGAFAHSVRNLGPVTTYGPNDMVLDNWGTVDSWVASDKITSYGPSGIGFVNFGTVNRLRVDGAIETFGQGARGFNVYAGTVHSAEFERVITHADGAVGIQISQPVGSIAVRRGIETYGGTGDSLVKGVVLKLSAIAFSVKPGGVAREVVVEGGLVTHGEGVEPLELHGSVSVLRIEGLRAGAGFDGI
ncbi:hypothetical protein [Paraburkholderia antibiotica]|uniref:Uncharacterized protein n=1 Tax=Paraburkholderia antibiotica TaxID=2728839 RepID=A0A7Y0A2E7_9BURK|nr:hypothetical protein [Paraburkholderia antibiotica]NML35242.1 hypothetical protein [Paraburkholderia antibiotica]